MPCINFQWLFMLEHGQFIKLKVKGCMSVNVDMCVPMCLWVCALVCFHAASLRPKGWGTSCLLGLQETGDHPLSRREPQGTAGVTGQELWVRGLEEGAGKPNHSCVVDGQSLPGAVVK